MDFLDMLRSLTGQLPAPVSAMTTQEQLRMKEAGEPEPTPAPLGAQPTPINVPTNQTVGTGPLNAQEALARGNPQVKALLEARQRSGLGAKPPSPTGVTSR